MKTLAVCVLALGMCFSGCGGDDDDDAAAGKSGGKAGSGPKAGSNGGPADCESFSACGGDVVGTWSLEDVCLGDLGASVGGDSPECADLVGESSVMSSGMLTFGADMKASGSASFSVSLSLSFNQACATALNLGTLDEMVCMDLQTSLMDATIKSATCTFADAACDCEVTTVDMMPGGDGNYSIDGNNLVDDEGTKNPYCVSGDNLTISTSTMMASATLLFSKQ